MYYFRLILLQSIASAFLLQTTAQIKLHKKCVLQKSKRSGEDEEMKDPIEKLFSFFFGQVEEKPMGLTRMSIETAPDQYPAELSRRAEPVASDDDVCRQFVRPTLAQTFLEKRQLRLAYDANIDGWSPEAFHQAVDRQGPGIILCTSVDGERFGGYNPKGYVFYAQTKIQSTQVGRIW
mmetsp:Transcript_4362/g.6178  ORF Transcript_4362/g.6178 Transcript_4362/m.6178 type:complete len:178 (-) Transcript_4362:2219-2752(-)